MRKFIFYMPAVLFSILYGGVANYLSINMISPAVFVWIVLFIASGFLLNKGKSWAGILGILPGIHLIYMSTKDTGQVINIEFPTGVVILIFYVFCSGVVIYKEKF